MCSVGEEVWPVLRDVVGDEDSLASLERGLRLFDDLFVPSPAVSGTSARSDIGRQIVNRTKAEGPDQGSVDSATCNPIAWTHCPRSYKILYEAQGSEEILIFQVRSEQRKQRKQSLGGLTLPAKPPRDWTRKAGKSIKTPRFWRAVKLDLRVELRARSSASRLLASMHCRC